MNQKVLNKIFVWGFLFLYLLVACISFCHAVQFFNIGNVQWMSITLAFAFELGLALSLAAILLSDSNKNNVLPWILMIVLCAVQVVGNVYSTYKYIAMSETDYYQYLAQPLLFWIEEISEQTVRIIISWIMGAILPVIALFMTDMVASNLKNMNSKDTENVEDETLASPIITTTLPPVEDKPIIEDETEDKTPTEDEEDVPEFKTEVKPAESKFDEIKSMFKKANPTVLPPTTPAPESKKDESMVAAPVKTKDKEDPVINRHKDVYKADESYFRDPTKKI